VAGAPPWFGVLFALVIVLGIVSLLVRVGLARRFAREAGIDEDEAAAAAVFGTGAVTATYLASSAARQRSGGQAVSDAGHVVANLSGEAPPVPSAAAPPRSAAERLRELEQLRRDALITAAEYDTRRQAILDDV
jgi:hypothetical protein